MTITYDVFDQGLSESISSYVDRLNTYLQGLGLIGIQDIALSKRLNMSTIRYELTLQYTTGGVTSFNAAYFAEDNDTDLDASIAAYFALVPNARIQFIRDVSEERRRSLVQNAVLAIYTQSLLPNVGPDRGRPLIMEPLAPIAPGASGPVQLVTATGVLIADTLIAFNRSSVVWAAGARGYVVQRGVTGIWDGYPTCC